jgi:hypothetical protein
MAKSFPDHPDFLPKLTPREIFDLGSFGGTYWRPIYSSVTKKHYNDVHKTFKTLKGLPDSLTTNDFNSYDTSVNKYRVKVGSTLEFWESHGWIHPDHPYGWIHWYVSFYEGARCEDDLRQIGRWKAIGNRFKKRLINMIRKRYETSGDKKGALNDWSISPKIRQTLQHWGYTIELSEI